jgi:hypothetical protein
MGGEIVTDLVPRFHSVDMIRGAVARETARGAIYGGEDEPQENDESFRRLTLRRRGNSLSERVPGQGRADRAAAEALHDELTRRSTADYVQRHVLAAES